MYVKDINENILMKLKNHVGLDNYYEAKFMSWPTYSKNPWISLTLDVG